MADKTDDQNSQAGKSAGTGCKQEATAPTRRDAIRIGVGAVFAPALLQESASAQSGTAAGPREAAPFQGIRIIERSKTLAGRLAGQLFADQGAEVFVERWGVSGPNDLDNDYFDRGKIVLPLGSLSDTSSADIIIVDGEKSISRAPHQIVIRVTAAVPGDEAYGHLPADCSEDLLNALVGFYTDMSITGAMLGRPVIYSPLPLCSVYAGVNGAVAAAAALVDRERTGRGREIIASRLAGGLSAIGALALTSKGLPEHLSPIVIGGLPEGMTPEQFRTMTNEARANPARQLYLEQRFAPLSAPYRALDGRFILPMAGPNRRLTERCLRALGLWEEALAAGMVDANAYDPANFKDARRNLADSLALGFNFTSMLADRLAPIFASRTAAEWERSLNASGVPATVILSWEDWQRNAHARESRIFTSVHGVDGTQIGRPSWVASAQPYPDLQAARRADCLPARSVPPPKDTGTKPSRLPLAGYTLVDFSNVVAGPSAGRMFVELGATVYSVVPMAPNHSPTIVVMWSGELAAGKRSIIVNAGTAGGAEVIRKLVAKADFVLGNMLDDQMTRLRIDPLTLAQFNPSAIGIQLAALRGERRGERHNDMGYDPAQQGTTGVMVRFGPEGAPTFHGIASCVDYLCGYLAVWAGLVALVARERRKDGRGDWAETSLATAATLTQILLQRTREPASARGADATGMNAGERVYQLSDGWIFAQAPRDISAELASKTVAAALAVLKARGINAVPVQTVRQLADRHRDKPSRTVRFERTESDGWTTECFAPTWLVFDGVIPSRPPAASRIGADGPAVLADLGYGRDDIERFVSSGVIGRTEWSKV